MYYSEAHLSWVNVWHTRSSRKKKCQIEDTERKILTHLRVITPMLCLSFDKCFFVIDFLLNTGFGDGRGGCFPWESYLLLTTGGSEEL